MISVIKIEPRFQETDAMGVIHHSVYPIWFELARVKYCTDIGMPFHKIFDLGLTLALAEVHVYYHKPIRFGMDVTIHTSLIKSSGYQMLFLYELYDEHHVLLSKGETKLAWVNQDMQLINIKKTHQTLYNLFLKHVKT